MASSNANQFLGDNYENSLKIYGGSAVTAFKNKVILFNGGGTSDTAPVGKPVIHQKMIDNAYSSQFVMFNQSNDDPEEHTSGDELLGQQWEAVTDSIELDEKPLVAHRSISERDLIVSHFDVLQTLGEQCGYVLADFWDKRLIRLAVLAARSAALTSNGMTIHNGGNRVERVAASEAAAYPVTSTGARNFRDDTDSLARSQDEDDVPENDRLLIISPRMRQVLQQDPGIFDIAYTRDNPNSQNQRAIGMISGYTVQVANNRLPSTVVNTGPTRYQGDFTVAGSTGQPVAIALCGATEKMAAIGAVVAKGIVPEMDKSVRKGDLFMKASLFMGADIMHPWCAGVIDVDDS